MEHQPVCNKRCNDTIKKLNKELSKLKKSKHLLRSTFYATNADIIRNIEAAIEKVESNSSEFDFHGFKQPKFYKVLPVMVETDMFSELKQFGITFPMDYPPKPMIQRQHNGQSGSKLVCSFFTMNLFRVWS